jgi:hypothetical protein
MAHNWTPPVACALSKSLLLHTDSRPHGWADRLISMLSAWLKPQESVWVWSRSPSGSYSAFATRHSPYRLVRQPAFGCDLGLSHDCTDAVNPPVTIYLCTHCVKQRGTILEHRLGQQSYSQLCASLGQIGRRTERITTVRGCIADVRSPASYHFPVEAKRLCWKKSTACIDSELGPGFISTVEWVK